jgi:hypothetical protein
MENSIVLELQSMAASNDHDVGELLRKAKIVAFKLELAEFLGWINHELSGYPEDVPVPKYRKFRATVRLYNHYQHRQIPYYLPADIENAACDIDNRQPFGDLINLLKCEENEFPVRITPTERDILLRGQRSPFPMEPIKVVNRLAVSNAIDGVRGTLLDWALQLEKAGIKGKGIEFTPAEQKKASSNTYVNYGIIQGMMGEAVRSNVSQQLALTVKSGNFKSLRTFLQSQGIDDDAIKSLQSAVKSDGKPTTKEFGPKVTSWMSEVIGKVQSGASSLGTGVLSSLIANALWKFYGFG